MPNFFVEAVTVSGGKVYSETKEIVVPPEKRVLNVAVTPSEPNYKPGEKAKLKVQLTDHTGENFVGSTVLTVYDKSVEYISGGSNVPEIKEFFWKWRRHHNPQTEASVNQTFNNLLRRGERGMSNLGVFGATVIEELRKNQMQADGRRELEATDRLGEAQGFFGRGLGGGFGGMPPAAPMAAMRSASGPADARFRQDATSELAAANANGL